MKEKITAAVYSLLSAMAISISGVYVEQDSFLGTLRDEMNGIGIGSLIVLIALFCFYYYMEKRDRREHWTIYVLSGLFSGFMLIGLSFTQNGNLDFVWASRQQLAVAILTFLGYAVLFCPILEWIYQFLRKQSSEKKELTHRQDGSVRGEHRKQNRIRTRIEKHWFLCAFLMIATAWLPWLLINLPASASSDACAQLMQAYGYLELTDMHSWVLTLFMGRLLSIGQHVSDNFALFLIVCVLYLFEAFCYAGTCKIVSRWRIPFGFKMTLVIFFAVFPIFGAYAQAILKDSPFMAAFVLYMAVYLDICIGCMNRSGASVVQIDDGTAAKSEKRAFYSFLWRMALLLLFGMLLCVLRNNGAYLVLPASLLLIPLLKKGIRRYGVLLFATSCAFFWLYGNVLAPAAGVQSISASTRGILFMPFQITGRYLSEYPDDLTDSEKEILDSAFREYETLGEVYMPEKADAVKAKYRKDYSNEMVNSYLSVVFSMIRRHPGVCLEAVLNQSYGYYYPFYNCDVMDTWCFYIGGRSSSVLEHFDFSYITSESARKALKNYANLWKKIPGVAQLMNPAAPTWVLLILAGYLIYCRKWKRILILAAPALNMMICILSPVNGYMRYAMPVLACLPLLLYACLIFTAEDPKQRPEASEQMTQRN